MSHEIHTYLQSNLIECIHCNKSIKSYYYRQKGRSDYLVLIGIVGRLIAGQITSLLNYHSPPMIASSY